MPKKGSSNNSSPPTTATRIVILVLIIIGTLSCFPDLILARCLHTKACLTPNKVRLEMNGTIVEGRYYFKCTKRGEVGARLRAEEIPTTYNPVTVPVPLPYRPPRLPLLMTAPSSTTSIPTTSITNRGGLSDEVDAAAIAPEPKTRPPVIFSPSINIKPGECWLGVEIEIKPYALQCVRNERNEYVYTAVGCIIEDRAPSSHNGNSGGIQRRRLPVGGRLDMDQWRYSCERNDRGEVWIRMVDLSP